jgi:hypothetical protein
MPYRLSNIGPIVFVRWQDEILAADALAIEADIKKRRVRAGEPLTVLWIIPAALKLVSGEARAALDRAVGAMKDSFRHVHVVIEGAGFLTAAYHSMFTPPFWRSEGGARSTVHESVEGCLEAVARVYDVEAAALLTTATFQRVID